MFRLVCRLFTFCCLLAVAGTGLAASLSPAEIYAGVSPSVALLSIETKAGKTFFASAFLAYDDATAVTSWHAVHDAERVTAVFSSGETFVVEGVADYDQETDLAILRLPPTSLPAVVLSAHEPAIGSWVYAIGAPRGYESSIVEGLLSGRRLIDGIPQFQVSCPFSPGNSGGPIVNDAGEVFGVASWSKRNAQNLNFAIPVSMIAVLDRSGTTVSWTDLPGQAPARKETQAAVSSGDSFDDFKASIRARSGEPVTITIKDGDSEESFSFTLP